MIARGLGPIEPRASPQTASKMRDAPGLAVDHWLPALALRVERTVGHPILAIGPGSRPRFAPRQADSAASHGRDCPFRRHVVRKSPTAGHCRSVERRLRGPGKTLRLRPFWAPCPGPNARELAAGSDSYKEGAPIYMRLSDGFCRRDRWRTGNFLSNPPQVRRLPAPGL